MMSSNMADGVLKIAFLEKKMFKCLNIIAQECVE